MSSEFFMREVLGMEREWGVLAWDVAGKGICYMCLEAAGYLFLVCFAGGFLPPPPPPPKNPATPTSPSPKLRHRYALPMYPRRVI